MWYGRKRRRGGGCSGCDCRVGGVGGDGEGCGQVGAYGDWGGF